MSTGGIALGVKIDAEIPTVQRMHARARNRRGFMAAVGKAGEVALRAHFAKREAEPNRRGWPKTHFWNRRIRTNTVLTEIGETLAVIDIAAPEFRQKLYGGEIRPTGNRKFLALPARAEAYGRSPLSFGNLVFRPTGPGRGVLEAQNVFGPFQRGVRRARGQGAVYYFLVRSVVQSADPRALPPWGTFSSAITKAGQEFLDREASRA